MCTCADLENDGGAAMVASEVIYGIRTIAQVETLGLLPLQQLPAGDVNVEDANMYISVGQAIVCGAAMLASKVKYGIQTIAQVDPLGLLLLSLLLLGQVILLPLRQVGDVCAQDANMYISVGQAIVCGAAMLAKGVRNGILIIVQVNTLGLLTQLSILSHS